VTRGVLRVVMLEGTVRQVRVEGSRWFKADSIAGMSSAQPGDVIDSDKLEQDLEWINRNPFRQVDLVYEKGSALGGTDLVLRAKDVFPVSVSAGYDDSGTPLTSNHRLSVGVTWGDVFRHDGLLSYQFFASPELRNFRAHSGVFAQPLPWRHTLTIMGSYADVEGRVPPPMTMTGYNWQTGFRYEAPLPDLRGYKHSLAAGFDFKRSNNDLAFGGTQVFGGPTDVDQWSASYSGGLRDAWGGTSLQATLYWSPGKMTASNDDAHFKAARAGATAAYTYARFQLNRTTRLPFDFSLVDALTFQLSDSNLLPSEQIGFGGYDTVRGYDTRVFNSDHGYLISTELRTPSASLLAVCGLRDLAFKLKDGAQLLGFVDYGAGGNRDRLPGERREVKLLGAGVGVRYAILPYLSFRADYGWQLLNEAEAARPYASRSHIGVIVKY
jgi:hemolysin activation/secretion protein